MDTVQAEHYEHPALIPVTAGVPGHAPRKPSRLRATATADGVELTWRGGGTSYAVYRFAGAHAQVGGCDLADATHLVGTTRDHTWTDPTSEPGEAYTYVVTALDRAYRESATSRASWRGGRRCCTNGP
jgi:hypothetical protein